MGSAHFMLSYIHVREAPEGAVFICEYRRALLIGQYCSDVGQLSVRRLFGLSYGLSVYVSFWTPFHRKCVSGHCIYQVEINAHGFPSLRRSRPVFLFLCERLSVIRVDLLRAHEVCWLLYQFFGRTRRLCRCYNLRR